MICGQSEDVVLLTTNASLPPKTSDFRGKLCQEPQRLTPRWSQRRLRLEFMNGLSYTTIIEPAEPLARRRGSALDR
jgi:hypothetical protein